MANMIFNFMVRSFVRKTAYSTFRGKVHPMVIGIGCIILFYLVGLYGGH